MPFNQVNQDALSVPIDNAATGPHVGFLEAFNNSYEAQVRASAMFGIEKAFGDIEDQQLRALRSIGVEAVGRLSDHSLDVARFYEDGGDDTTAKRMKDYDTRIDELKTKYPQMGLRNSRELWETVKLTAQDREKKVALNRNTALGSVGEFIGAAGGSIDPRTDPLNFVTAPVGGIGKTAAARIAVQGAGQGAIEAVNQLTGVQEERRLLGLSHGFTDALSRVGGAVVGGAALQGIGEGFVAAGKRWFTPGKNDPAPPPPGPKPAQTTAPPAPELKPASPAEIRLRQQVSDFLNEKYDGIMGEQSPHGTSRSGIARTVLDADYMRNELRSWEAEPNTVKPPGETALPRQAGDVRIPEMKAAEIPSLDEVARRVDPHLFRQFDGLATQVNVLRAEIERLKPDTVKKQELQSRAEKSDALRRRIQTLNDKMYTVGKRRREEMRTEKDALEKELYDHEVLPRGTDTPEITAKRKRLMEIDYKMRDMAPLVNRAYAQAQGQWSATQSMRDRVNHMIRTGQNKLPAVVPVADKRLGSFDEADAAFKPLSLLDRAPILQQSSKVEAQMRPDADAADYAKAIVADNMKVYDEAVDNFRGSIGKILKDEKNNTVSIAGSEYKLDLDKDKIVMSLDDGSGTRTVTVRQLLEELQEAEEALKATQKCSI